MWANSPGKPKTFVELPGYESLVGNNVLYIKPQQLMYTFKRKGGGSSKHTFHEFRASGRLVLKQYTSDGCLYKIDAANLEMYFEDGVLARVVDHHRQVDTFFVDGKFSYHEYFNICEDREVRVRMTLQEDGKIVTERRSIDLL